LWLEEQQVPYGESAIAPEAPEVEGFNFVGWDTDFSFVTSDLAVNAIYENTDITHKLTLSVEGKGKIFFGIYNALGELQEVEATEPSYDLTEGAQFLLIAKADNGWRFDGWSDGETKEQHAITLTSDITLTAKFIEISDGVEEIENGKLKVESPQKVLRNGQVIILMPDGREFDVTGAEVR
ncbi:MAG: InlB B-repeat-containing protein, partial [Paludibacteraceae bacterium]|nr:InlB B-repeat-containing protein [Paludibacteraceae bacterium]